MKTKLLVAVLAVMVATGAIPARAEDSCQVPCSHDDHRGFYVDPTEGYHFAGHFMSGPGITVDRGRSELVVPFVGFEMWAAKYNHGKYFFGGIAPSIVTVYGKEQGLRFAWGLQISPVALHVYSDKYKDTHVYVKLAYTRLWAMQSERPVPSNSIGVQFFISSHR